ncbi:MAG: undecaprenyl/decaprenyl-phosphate alpha-N-acetylglucosaminyl 1-phosphate transferase [Pirellulales bacterium]|nr:undecaprenyl/decaprenyl-phosphate alpha-N-acetylglucosaminyl 1-phosphate transferase [Pirellulales bacterium]
MGSEPTIFLLACLVSLGLTALIREIAPRIGLTDDPDGHRKLHGRATALGGGVAVYLTTAVILGTLWLTPSPPPVSSNDGAATAVASRASEAASSDATHETPPVENEPDGSISDETINARSVPLDMPSKLRDGYKALPSLLLAGLLIVLLGLVDDWKGLKGKHKLLGQMVSASVLMFGGLVIHRVDVFNYEISFGILAYPITLLWLLGAINALNLLDGIDGLATMLGIILSCTIAAIAVVVMTSNHGVAIIAMVFAGSLLGFMRFNFPPASIFLGDSGSMLIGLVVGALAIGGSLKGPGTVLLAAPLAIWTIPFFDSAAAILRRKLTGRSIYETDRAHLHHRLLNLLGSNRKVLGWVAACCAVIAVATLVGLIRRDDRIMLITCVGIVAISITTGIFGRVELFLIGTRLRGFGRTLVSPILTRRNEPWQTSIRLQGHQQWDLLWATFVESADKLRLIKIRLDVNMPTVHEAYHASWERPSHGPSGSRWYVEIPLVLKDQPVGVVRVTGQRNHQSACSDIQQLMELVEPFESRLESLSLNSDSTNSADKGSKTEVTTDSDASSLPPRAAPK